MNTFRNTVSLMGNLGKDPVLTEFGDNNAVARFSIATNENYQNKKGEWITQTTWHNIVAWGALANRCKTQLKKGIRVILEGKLVNDEYETKEGEKRYKTEIVLRKFMKIDNEKSTDETEKSKILKKA